mgnify:CR=1 FL=1
MKQQYENRTRYMLPRRSHTIIRIDGRCFHTYARKADKPFDNGLMRAMDATAVYLCEEIQGSRFAYVQSDEISVMITDFSTITSEAWFNGNVQKMASVGASMATMQFNRLMRDHPLGEEMNACFDARVFTIPDPVEVANYFIWRQQDWIRNSIAMVAGSHYSQKELFGKDMAAQYEMIRTAGDNWAGYSVGEKNGRVVRRIGEAGASMWMSEDAVVFTAYPDFLAAMIPPMPAFNIMETVVV